LAFGNIQHAHNDRIELRGGVDALTFLVIGRAVLEVLASLPALAGWLTDVESR
jgi:hypothetical protein